MSSDEPNINADTRDLLRWGDEGPQYDRPPHEMEPPEYIEMPAEMDQFLRDRHTQYTQLMSGI